MSKGAKGLVLITAAYVVTMGFAVLIILSVIMFLIDTNSCSAISRAMLILWGAVATVFLTSVIVVGVLAWRIFSEIAGRVAVMVLYAMALLLSYIILALGLLVVFNC